MPDNPHSQKMSKILMRRCTIPATVLSDYIGYFDERFVQRLSIRKYAQAHDLNRGSVDHLQRKFFMALAQTLKERDDADGRSRLQTK